MAAAAAAAAAEQKIIASLRDGVLLLDLHPQDAPVRIDAVEVRHASPLLEVLLKGKESFGWKVPKPNFTRVQHLAKVCVYIDTILLAVLPLLEQDPSDLTASRLLRRYGFDINHHARKVDGKHGPFHDVASDASRILRDANKALVREKEPIGAEKMAVIRQAMEGMKLLLVVLPHDEAGGGGGGGGDE